MHKIALMIVAAGFSLGGCAHSPLEADYGESVAHLTTDQVYDSSTLTRASAAAVVGADPDMINLAVTTMRTEATDRKEVSKPLIVQIGGNGQ